MERFLHYIKCKIRFYKISNTLRYLIYYWKNGNDWGLVEPTSAPVEIRKQVDKKYPGFDCYMSTIGSDNKPVIVVHRCFTQTELLSK